MIPVCGTNRIPWNTIRSGHRLRPGCRARCSAFGGYGSATAHDSSSASHGFGRAAHTPGAPGRG